MCVCDQHDPDAPHPPDPEQAECEMCGEAHELSDCPDLEQSQR